MVILKWVFKKEYRLLVKQTNLIFILILTYIYM